MPARPATPPPRPGSPPPPPRPGERPPGPLPAHPPSPSEPASIPDHGEDPIGRGPAPGADHRAGGPWTPRGRHYARLPCPRAPPHRLRSSRADVRRQQAATPRRTHGPVGALLVVIVVVLAGAGFGYVAYRNHQIQHVVVNGLRAVPPRGWRTSSWSGSTSRCALGTEPAFGLCSQGVTGSTATSS